ncbi:CinA family protein [Bradyrhizobium betae]
MKELVGIAEQVAAQLIARKQTIAVAESSTGGLISASLLAIPGASAYYLGGAVVYTRDARRVLMDISDEGMKGFRSSSEPYAKLLRRPDAQSLQLRLGTLRNRRRRPTGNRYGDAAGHGCMAVSGPTAEVITLETGSGDRFEQHAGVCGDGVEVAAEEIGELSCFAARVRQGSLATNTAVMPREAGHPVRRGPSLQLTTASAYWIARSSRAMISGNVAHSSPSQMPHEDPHHIAVHPRRLVIDIRRDPFDGLAQGQRTAPGARCFRCPACPRARPSRRR